ncbi:MAG: chromate efflux transporter [Syntrophaceae bacterium]|nr:chromate efflux transporter [Syntrophaceae bacterium]
MLPLNKLFIRFLQLGAMAYGGPAVMGQMKQTFVNKYHWMKEEEFLQGMALCQPIPGATLLQMATYTGYRLRGIQGALIAASAFILPAFISLLVLSSVYFKFQSLWLIQALFKGLGAMVVAIVLNASITLGRSIMKDWKISLITLLSFLGFFLHLNILFVFLFAAVAALLLRPKIPEPTIPSPPERLKKEGSIKTDLILLGSLAVLILMSLTLSYLVSPPLASLFLVLSKVGALAFGGGFTMIPLIQYEVVDRFQWLTTKEFLDGIAMGQVTPGPIMITATFIGYKLSGIFGGLIATIAIFYPSFFILTLLIPYHDRLKRVREIRIMEQGILGSFIGMLGLVLYNFARTSLVDIPTLLMAAGTYFALYKRVPLPYVLISGSILSVILFGLLK